MTDKAWRPGAVAGSPLFRPRLEQRFGWGDETGHRARAMLRLSYAFSETPVMLVAPYESFYQLNKADWGLESGFDQNRLFAGVGIPSALGPRFELGFMHVFQNRSPTDHILKILAVNVFWTF